MPLNMSSWRSCSSGGLLGVNANTHDDVAIVGELGHVDEHVYLVVADGGRPGELLDGASLAEMASERLST